MLVSYVISNDCFFRFSSIIEQNILIFLSDGIQYSIKMMNDRRHCKKTQFYLIFSLKDSTMKLDEVFKCDSSASSSLEVPSRQTKKSEILYFFNIKIIKVF